MTKKLRDSAYVNDLVLYRNACEEKKLKFTLSQLENLKVIYSRQKDQEKMFFAVQHMAVPVKTNRAIMNLRNQLHLDNNRRTQSAPVPSVDPVDPIEIPLRSKSTYPEPPSNQSEIITDRKSSVLTFKVDENKQPRQRQPSWQSNQGFASQLSKLTDNKGKDKLKSSRRTISPHPQKISSNRGKDKLTSSRRTISPHPQKFPGSRKNVKNDVRMLDGRKNNSSTRDINKNTRATHLFATETDNSVKSHKNSIIEQINEESVDEGALHDTPESRYSSIRSNTDNKEGDIDRLSSSYYNRHTKEEKSPISLNDLPPVNTNAYDAASNERDSREIWQNITEKMRNSCIRETKTEAEQNKHNREIREKWVSSYETMKRDRIASMMKDHLRMKHGEQLTLVKFLPKSRQFSIIKEAQFAQQF